MKDTFLISIYSKIFTYILSYFYIFVKYKTAEKID